MEYRMALPDPAENYEERYGHIQEELEPCLELPIKPERKQRLSGRALRKRAKQQRVVQIAAEFRKQVVISRQARDIVTEKEEGALYEPWAIGNESRMEVAQLLAEAVVAESTALAA
jgi:hypothetical protein